MYLQYIVLKRKGYKHPFPRRLRRFAASPAAAATASGGSTSGQQWALPSQFNDLPPPPSCVALIFICPSIIAQEQLGQIKGIDDWILLWR